METNVKQRQAVAPAPDRQKAVTTLYGEFEKAHAAMQAHLSAEAAVFDRLATATFRAAAKVVKAPARNIPEMLLKIRAAVFCIGPNHDRLEELDTWRPKGSDTKHEEYLCLVSLRDDLTQTVSAATLRRSRVA